MYYTGHLGGPITQQAVGTAASTGVAVTGAVLAPGAVSMAALAVPIVGAVAAAGILIYTFISRRNAQKVAATNVVNEIEPYLQRNRDAFLAAAASGAASENDRQAALAAFDAGWAQVLHECGQASLGSAGRRCISERQSGGCLPNVQPCTNWFQLYRDPIQNATIAGGGPGLLSSVFAGGGVGADPRLLLLAGILVVGAMWL